MTTKKEKIYDWQKKSKLKIRHNYQSHGHPQAHSTRLVLSSEDQQSAQSDADSESIPTRSDASFLERTHRGCPGRLGRHRGPGTQEGNQG